MPEMLLYVGGIRLWFWERKGCEEATQKQKLTCVEHLLPPCHTFTESYRASCDLQLSGDYRCLRLCQRLPSWCSIQSLCGVRLWFLQDASWQQGSLQCVSWWLHHIHHRVSVTILMCCRYNCWHRGEYGWYRWHWWWWHWWQWHWEHFGHKWQQYFQRYRQYNWCWSVWSSSCPAEWIECSSTYIQHVPGQLSSHGRCRVNQSPTNCALISWFILGGGFAVVQPCSCGCCAKTCFLPYFSLGKLLHALGGCMPMCWVPRPSSGDLSLTLLGFQRMRCRLILGSCIWRVNKTYNL